VIYKERLMRRAGCGSRLPPLLIAIVVPCISAAYFSRSSGGCRLAPSRNCPCNRIRPSTRLKDRVMSAFKPLVFSGVQPTGNLHLGNYLGAIRKFVALQEDNDCIYCVVDLHALTAQLVHEDMRSQIRSIAASFIASGIDPKKHIVFNPSAVPQ